jgi:hypothetical protein
MSNLDCLGACTHLNRVHHAINVLLVCVHVQMLIPISWSADILHLRKSRN